MNLKGRSVLVLRPSAQARVLGDTLRDRGAEPILVPAIAIRPPESYDRTDAAIDASETFSWTVFTSVNGVRILLDRADARRSTFRPARVAAVGPETAAALERRGLPDCWLPSAFTTAAIADELPVQGGDVLLVRAQAADTRLEDRLRERGVHPQRLDAYRTIETNHDRIREALAAGVHAVLLTSASIARSFATAAAGASTAAVCCIGPATAAAARAAGLPVDAEASRHTTDGIIAALEALPDEPQRGRAS